MLIHRLHPTLPDIDHVLDPTLLVSSLLKLISTELTPSPAEKFTGQLDTFTKCIISEAEALTTTSSNVLEIEAEESISKSIQEWANFTGKRFNIKFLWQIKNKLKSKKTTSWLTRFPNALSIGSGQPTGSLNKRKMAQKQKPTRHTLKRRTENFICKLNTLGKNEAAEAEEMV